MRSITNANQLDFSKLQDPGSKEFLIPAIVVDEADLASASLRTVRMLGFMNREGFEATLVSGAVTFYSRSTGQLWQKGETSGNVLRVRDIAVDCDNDTLLITVDAQGPTCHTEAQSCFEQPDIGE